MRRKIKKNYMNINVGIIGPVPNKADLIGLLVGVTKETNNVHKKELVTRMDPQVRTGSRDNNENDPTRQQALVQ